tara:strand:- start:783 stop:6557 length:5775 start_codon:yes stop_codon:yes gene_type:complete
MAEKRFIKGLFKDTGHIDQPEGSWRYAKNTIINDKKGSISNEGGTELSGFLNFESSGQKEKIIGAVEVNEDKAILFLKDVVTTYAPPATAPRSEIGIWENGVYTTVFKPFLLPPGKLTNDLNFQETNPIEGTFKIDSKGDLIVYWTDDLNPPRAFNIDRQIRTSGVSVWNLYGIVPGSIDNIDILNLFPYSGPVPHTFLHDIYWAFSPYQKSVNSGGGLLTGVYYLALAYVDDDNVATNFLTVSNPVSIVEEFDATKPTTKKDGMKAGSQTTKCIAWKVSNFNRNYKYVRPVIIRKKGDATEALRINDLEINPNQWGEMKITFTGLEGFTPSSVKDIIIDTVSYETAKTVNQLDGVLYLGNLTSRPDLGYQKYANNIKLYPVVREFEDFDRYIASVDNFQTGWGGTDVDNFGGGVIQTKPAESYRYAPNAFQWKGYMRDEVYAFYIAFVMKDGSMSYAYHIPGREAQDNELLDVGSLAGNTYGGLWTDFETLSTGQAKRFHYLDSFSHDGANNSNWTLPLYRNMNYWQNNTEFYPNNSNFEVWDMSGYTGAANDLKGLYIRHHHFPSNRHTEFKTITDEKKCRTTGSIGTVNQVPAWNGTLVMIDGRLTNWSFPTGSWPWYKCCSNWTRNQFNMGKQPGNNCSNPQASNSVNNPAMEAALWDFSANHFKADQTMTVTVRWQVVHRQKSNLDPNEPIHTRIISNTAANGWTVEGSDQDNPNVNWFSGSNATGGAYTGTCGHAGSECGCGILGEEWVGSNSSREGTGAITVNLGPGDTIHMESQKETASGSSMFQAGHDAYCDLCIDLNHHYSFMEFQIVSAASTTSLADFNDADVNHKVQRLGFTLEDIQIPRSIADQVQGFRIYYAKRTHADRTILGQDVLIPGLQQDDQIGLCAESQIGSASEIAQSNQIMSTLQDQPEVFYNLDPYMRDWQDYPVLQHYNEGVTAVGGIVTGEPALNVFTFHDFYLLRTKNSLASATHINIEYYVENLVWNGPGLEQDKKMITKIIDNSTLSPPQPNEIVEEWGWDAQFNCYPQLMKSAIMIGAIYKTPDVYTMPRMIGQKAKTYLLGDSIFEGKALGFGGKLMNEFGESCIVFKLMDDHALNAFTHLRSYPGKSQSSTSDGGGTAGDNAGFFDSQNLSTGVGEYGYGGLNDAILVNSLDNTGNWSPANGSVRSNSAVVNLKAFKTDVYKSIDDQELVWTGFEVLGQDLNNFIFEDNGTPSTFVWNGPTGAPYTYTSDFSVTTLQSTIQRDFNENPVAVSQTGIYGGDTFICRYGKSTSIKHNQKTLDSDPQKALHYHIVESTDNINFRHQEDADSQYFPQGIAKEVLRNAGIKDFMHFDNLRYNDNYSENNDIRPAIPLPLKEIDQTDFPTRTHRSTKNDPTSLIDNYRIFKANQFKDLPKNRGDLWKLASFNNLLYFHMEESLFAAKGKQSMQMKDGSEAFVGSGDIFQQEPDEIIQTSDGFAGNQSQYATLTTRYGYFFVDIASKKVFLMKTELSEISNLGMEEWFRDNLRSKLEAYGFVQTCTIDNPILGLGMHSIYDPKYKRILLTKRDLKPTIGFIEGYNAYDPTINPSNWQYHNTGDIRWDASRCAYERAVTIITPGPPQVVKTTWTILDWSDETFFTKSGWTISYYPELGIWCSFHDYVPYIYFNTSTDFYSATDIYPRPGWIAGPMTPAANWIGTTFGNIGIWKHNSDSNKGILYQENFREYYTDAEFAAVTNYYPFEFEFIHNETKSIDSLTSSISYTLETFNQAGISVLEHGFTSFLIYNTLQISGIGTYWQDLIGAAQISADGTTLTSASIDKLEYLINVRRVGNEWKINQFRDLASLAVNTGPYYTATGTNVTGALNVGTVTTSSTTSMFLVEDMHEIVNAAFIDLGKNWDKKKKFMDKWIGIRLIYDNITNNLLNLYSTDVGSRQIHR